jgi:CRP/FNR family transcriptional regulator, cyclic AMP receptor protein
MIETLQLAVQDYAFFGDLSAHHTKAIISCAKSVDFPEQYYIFRAGDAAHYFYIVHDGLVSIELLVPGRGVTRLQTLDRGEVLGWSWIAPPYRWHFDARALRRTHALAFDVDHLRAKCEEDHNLGYAMMKRLTDVIVTRLDATRLQLLDLYGSPS